MLKNYIINKDQSIYNALELLEKNPYKILFVVDSDDKIIGSLTDGDIRRYILSTGNLSGTTYDACTKNFLFLNESKNKSKVTEQALSVGAKVIPVLNNQNKLIEIIFLEDHQEKIIADFENIEYPVIIMAGGQGTRLEPFTKVLPKPLIPINDKTILEIIIEIFNNYGFNNFYVSINYKGYIIKSYLNECKFDFQINYIEESQPLGTIGALSLIKNQINSDFVILTNCDIIIDIDYLSLIEFHKKNQNDITIVASTKKYKIPYGVCHLDKNGFLANIEEKPEFHFLVNTGMYIINTQLLQLIPESTLFHATNLIEIAKEKGYKISIYPVSDNAWIDIGEWTEYKKTLSKFNI